MEIIITPQSIVVGIMAISAFVVAVDKLIDALRRWKNKAKEPEDQQNIAIEELKQSEKKLTALLDRDDKRLRILEDGVSVLVKGQLAMLGHAIDGNNERECREARKDINHYLITK